MNWMRQLFDKLGYNRENGLFYLEEAADWIGKFPYRIGRVLKDVIKPYAFYSPFYGVESTEPDHPEPLNSPIILFFDHPDQDVEQNIPRWTFSFSQAPIVIINRDDYEPLEIYHGYNFDGRDRQWLKRIEDKDAGIEDFSVLNLITGKTWDKLYDNYFKGVKTVDKSLLKNITDARRILIAKDTGGLDSKAANRLIGRLLFVRYLIDRDVSFPNDRYIKGNSKSQMQKSLEQLLQDKDDAYGFFKSITKQFNGDLFPLTEQDETGKIIYDEEYEVEQRHLDVMYYLFTCSKFFSEDGTWKEYSVQKSLFNVYDFEVIPVELISNIYENFLKETGIENLGAKSISRQKEIQAYYTPPFLVDYVLSQTVTPHLEKMTEASCRVLDPACGSGIFLVETLRKLIEKEIQINPVPGLGNKPTVPDNRLWEIVEENIFGIDIDGDAIEIAIFSIYITLLDYKTPKEIQSFRFRSLKGVNLFNADYFDESHHFNKFFKEDVNLDFIIGNPPWGGKLKISDFENYIETKSQRDQKENGVPLTISEKEISQAFMVRTGDFGTAGAQTRCAFVVTGKNLYNAKAAGWRSYFLNNYFISKVFELSSINNKKAGGNHVFEHARQSAAVIFFHPGKNNDNTGNSLVTHITARANDYWKYFKTVVIEKQDVKKILQRYFMETLGGHDWLWRVLLHGNLLDFSFIERLLESGTPFHKKMEELNLEFKGGLKPVDNSIKPANRKSTKEIRDWKYLEIDERGKNEEFLPFFISPSKVFKEKLAQLIEAKKIADDERVAQLPDIYFFKGKKLLLKNGLSPYFKAFAAVYDNDLVFTHSICSIKPKVGWSVTPECYAFFHIVSALFNSDLFTYYVFNAGTSAGIDIPRANFIDFLNFPTQTDPRIGKLAEQIRRDYESLYAGLPAKNRKDIEKKIESGKTEIESIIKEVYGISDEEQAFIDYTGDVSIPVFKRVATRSVLGPLSRNNAKDEDQLREYAEVFTAHFGQRFNSDEKYFIVNVYVTLSFIGFHFKIDRKPDSDERVVFKETTGVEEMINKIGELGYHKLSKDLYIRQDIRGFNKSSFYVIKPNQRKLWHKAVAYADLSEFVQSLVKAEIKRKSA